MSAEKELKKQVSQVQNDPQKFVHGVLLRGKFIGAEDVKEETGDDICQTSMIKLKAVVIAKKEHKQRICIKVNLEGVELLDEKTNDSMYKHSVNRISYIARDPTDARAIGYIYKNPNNTYQYFAIKTEKQAQELFNLLKELFETVLEMRNAKKNEDSTPVTETPKEPEKKIETSTSTPPITTNKSNDNLIDSLIDNQPVETPAPVETPKVTNNQMDLIDAFGSNDPPAMSSPPVLTTQKSEPPKQSASSDLFSLFDNSSPTTTTTTTTNNLSSSFPSSFPPLGAPSPNYNPTFSPFSTNPTPFQPMQPNNPNMTNMNMNKPGSFPNQPFGQTSFNAPNNFGFNQSPMMQQPTSPMGQMGNQYHRPPPVPAMPNQQPQQQLFNFNNNNNLNQNQMQQQFGSPQPAANTNSAQFPW